MYIAHRLYLTCLLQIPARQKLIRSLERAQQSKPKRWGHYGQHEGLVYMTKFHEGQLLTACELAGPAPRVRSMTVHDIPVRGAWLDMLCVSVLGAGSTVEMSCQLFPAKASCHVPALNVRISSPIYLHASHSRGLRTCQVQHSMMSGSHCSCDATLSPTFCLRSIDAACAAARLRW